MRAPVRHGHDCYHGNTRRGLGRADDELASGDGIMKISQDVFIFRHRIQMICRRNFSDNPGDLPCGYSATMRVDFFRYLLAGALIIAGIERKQCL
jgi:hypothetical protein